LADNWTFDAVWLTDRSGSNAESTLVDTVDWGGGMADLVVGE